MQIMTAFNQNPSFTYAVLQALLLMGLVDNTVVAKVVQATATGTPYSFMEDLPQIQREHAAKYGYQNQQASTQPPQGFNSQGGSGASVPPPPPSEQRQQQQQPQQPQPQQQAQVDPNQAALISQVLQLTEEQINMLPPDQQQVIRQLKASYQI